MSLQPIPQLDGLRAIAVILVIVSHWLPESHILNILPNGMMGVQLFFVLSGYLITKILLKTRGTKHAVRNFYVRRTLRIFPIYYLTLFALYLFRDYTSAIAKIDVNNSLIYHVTYTSNFYFIQQGWEPLISHLWSLSVEEQFYLIWPWFMLFIPKKYLLHSIISFIVLGAACLALINGFPRFVFTPCYFFAFGLGGLLSWFETYQQAGRAMFAYILNIISLFSLALFAFYFHDPAVSIICVDILSLWLIHWAMNKPSFLAYRPLTSLGKISYGLYLFHPLIPSLITENIIFRKLSLSDSWQSLSPLISAALLTVIAWLSFVLIEKRFLALKKYFDYQPVTKINTPNEPLVLK